MWKLQPVQPCEISTGRKSPGYSAGATRAATAGACRRINSFRFFDNRRAKDSVMRFAGAPKIRQGKSSEDSSGIGGLVDTRLSQTIDVRFTVRLFDQGRYEHDRLSDQRKLYRTGRRNSSFDLRHDERSGLPEGTATDRNSGCQPPSVIISIFL